MTREKKSMWSKERLKTIRDEILKKSGDTGKVKSYEEFGEAEEKKGPIAEFWPKIHKPNGDKPTPPKPPTTPAGVLPVPTTKRAAMKREGFKSFNEWLKDKAKS